MECKGDGERCPLTVKVFSQFSFGSFEWLGRSKPNPTSYFLQATRLGW